LVPQQSDLSLLYIWSRRAEMGKLTIATSLRGHERPSTLSPDS